MEKGPSTFAEYWTSEYSESYHYIEHGEEMGFKDIQSYSKAAKEFVNSNERGIKYFRAHNGSIYKYNSKTYEFAIISKSGRIVTYFIPSNPKSFIYNKFDECGDCWIN